MQKTSFFLLIVLALFAPSCSKGAFESVSADHANLLASYKVTSSDLMNYFLGVKGIVPTKVSDISVEPIVNGLDTVMYLVNYDDGWEVLSGDIRASKVLIFGEHGNISLSDLKSNPASSDYMDRLRSGMSQILHNEDFELPEGFYDSWDEIHVPEDSVFTLIEVITIDTLVYDVKYQDHLMATKWGQEYPWNQYCPWTDAGLSSRCEAGCVPVAAGQILYYLHNKIGVPEKTYYRGLCEEYIPWNANYLVLDESDFFLYNYDSQNWNNMAVDYSSTYGHLEASALLLQLGYLYGAEYYSSGTYAQALDSPGVFQEYGLDCQARNLITNPMPNTNLRQLIESQIYEDQIPVMMSIGYSYGDNTIYHSVVVDGYNYRNINILTTYAYYECGVDGRIIPGQMPVSVRYSRQLEQSTAVAVNWGYNGIGDSIQGSTVWYNLFTEWVVSLQNHPYNYNIKRGVVYDFEEMDG